MSAGERLREWGNSTADWLDRHFDSQMSDEDKAFRRELVTRGAVGSVLVATSIEIVRTGRAGAQETLYPVEIVCDRGRYQVWIDEKHRDAVILPESSEQFQTASGMPVPEGTLGIALNRESEDPSGTRYKVSYMKVVLAGGPDDDPWKKPVVEMVGGKPEYNDIASRFITAHPRDGAVRQDNHPDFDFDGPVWVWERNLQEDLVCLPTGQESGTVNPDDPAYQRYNDAFERVHLPWSHKLAGYLNGGPDREVAVQISLWLHDQDADYGAKQVEDLTRPADEIIIVRVTPSPEVEATATATGTPAFGGKAGSGPIRPVITPGASRESAPASGGE
jgi:hypothetical protein